MSLDMKSIPFRINRKEKRKLIYLINVLLAVVLISEIYFFYFSEIKENEKELDTWLGYYFFSAELEVGWRDYEISIFKIKGKYYAELTRSYALQPETRSLGYVKGDKNSINIFFKDILPGDSLYENDRYKEDELLIALSYADKELQTSWYALRQEYPKLEEKGEEVKGIYFKKIE